MVNIVGTADGAEPGGAQPGGAQPNWAAVDALPGTRTHLYHKAPRPGRKVGHVNLVAPDGETLRERLARLETLIP